MDSLLLLSIDKHNIRLRDYFHFSGVDSKTVTGIFSKMLTAASIDELRLRVSLATQDLRIRIIVDAKDDKRDSLLDYLNYWYISTNKTIDNLTRG